MLANVTTKAETMLLKAGIIGNRLSVMAVKSFCMLTLYEGDVPAFGVEHESEHLVFGDFVELVAPRRQAEIPSRG